MAVDVKGTELTLSCAECNWKWSSTQSYNIGRMAEEHIIYHALKNNPHGQLATDFEARHKEPTLDPIPPPFRH